MKNRIAALLLALCLAVGILPGTALAADTSGECGANGKNVTWTLNSAGVLTISGSGMMRDEYYLNRAPWNSDRNQVTTVIIGDGVNSAGDCMFYQCVNLTRVTLPDTLVRIGISTFRECSKLPRITIPDSVIDIDINSFRDCSKLDNVIIPDSVKTIGHRAFLNCSSLSSITIPDSVTDIGNSAFMGCTNLRTVTIPSAIISVSEEMFSGCTNLTSVNLPSGIETIWAKAFADCIRLKDIYFAGTKQQWENIYIDDSNDSILSKVTIHYNSGNAAQTQYTVTFNANEGSVNVTEKSVMQGSTYGTLPTPTRSGYAFNGWYTSKTGGTKITLSTKVTLTANQTLYAQWTKDAATAKTMTVTFNANSGTVTPKTATVTNGQTYGTLPEPTRTGYKFDGWYTTKTGGTKVTSSTKVTKTANHTIYAHWTKIRTFLVDLDANGGTVLTEYIAVTTNTRYRHLPTPTRSGYHFSGWYTSKTGGTKVTEATKVTNSVTKLYARWVKTNPTVKSRQTGSYQVVIPGEYKVLLHANETTATVTKTATAQSSEYTVVCTKMATLSNGTVRYYGKFPKVSNSTSYWFTFTDEMFIN